MRYEVDKLQKRRVGAVSEDRLGKVHHIVDGNRLADGLVLARVMDPSDVLRERTNQLRIYRRGLRRARSAARNAVHYWQNDRIVHCVLQRGLDPEKVQPVELRGRAPSFEQSPCDSDRRP